MAKIDPQILAAKIAEAQRLPKKSPTLARLIKSLLAGGENACFSWREGTPQ